MLHGARRRRAAGRLRHPARAHRRSFGHDRRGPGSRTPGRVGRRAHRHRRQPVRLLHAGHRPAPRRPRSAPAPSPTTRPRPALARPPVPLHRLADHRRGGHHGGRSAGRSRPGCRPLPSRAAGDDRGWTRPSGSGPTSPLGAGGFADDTAPAGRAGRGARTAAGEWFVAEIAGRGPPPRPGKVQGRRTTVRAGATRSRCPPGDWDADPAHDVGRAGLPRARRRRGARRAASRRSPLANGGAFGGKADSSVRGRGPPAGRRARSAGPGAC